MVSARLVAKDKGIGKRRFVHIESRSLTRGMMKSNAGRLSERPALDFNQKGRTLKVSYETRQEIAVLRRIRVRPSIPSPSASKAIEAGSGTAVTKSSYPMIGS